MLVHFIMQCIIGDIELQNNFSQSVQKIRRIIISSVEISFFFIIHWIDKIHLRIPERD